KVNVVTLGCSKNLVDSEELINQLEHNDFEVGHETEEPANIVIVNTCGFIDRAKEESINTILQYADAKNEGEIDKLYVTGCLSQRYKDDLEKEIPEVNAYEELGADYKHELLGERTQLTTPDHYAYLKISEGCNRTCSFCAIPLMRGKHVSKTIDQIINEAKHLVRNGVKEIMLIAQELTYYGLDIYKKRSLGELLDALAGIEGLDWIRLHYAYPHKFPMEIVEAMAKHDSVCNYLDIPLQHISDPVLTAMRRNITKAETTELIANIRKTVPGIAIRTTMLVGFPGETEEDVIALGEFIREQRFDRLGVFQYSHEENTSAHDLEDIISAEEKERRAAYIMEIQQEISFELNAQKIGKTYKVLFDRKEGAYFIGRTEFDSPEVDNEVMVKAADHYARVGDFAMVKINDATDFDLIGEIVKK
ncbi:UNVERIFIED_CONTAM: hypothetical protein GTU68_049748, partial [Idotea baltica]|nr:hypothetical protein [Idotea baltica]